MRANFAGFTLSVLVTLAAVSTAQDARAEEEFDVTVAGGKISVTTKGAWHINLAYPWKLTIGDQKLDAKKFALTEKSATLSGAPAGTGKLKGAVCAADTCKPFEKDVTVK